ncbi:hypothetical protein HOY82DRAFT_618242 [Tuber indicum]|nr:hypothetical protein HOY82DRAFT_618242 [Tuber indicum]
MQAIVAATMVAMGQAAMGHAAPAHAPDNRMQQPKVKAPSRYAGERNWLRNFMVQLDNYFEADATSGRCRVLIYVQCCPASRRRPDTDPYVLCVLTTSDPPPTLLEAV